ncbi:MAG: hypothetical protein CMO12_03775 [Thaumarchaeota archaeon]|nr:hypothetical protein [Nitrososphaerota archaeon]
MHPVLVVKWMEHRRSYLNVDRAFDILLSSITLKPCSETVPAIHSYTRVLAEEVIAPTSRPLLDTSHMDGFALRSADTVHSSKSNPLSLKIKGTVKLEDFPEKRVSQGEVFGILTGAHLPPGADAVVPKEKVYKADGRIEVSEPLRDGENVIRAGSDFAQRAVVFKEGHIVRAQDIGILAALGILEVRVYHKPRVAIINVGSELIESAENIQPGKTVSSHGFMISRVVSKSGGDPQYLGIAPDEEDKIVMAVQKGLRESDLVCTIGGSSMGETDLVERSINKLGDPGVIVHGLQLQPGRVGGFGVIDGKPIFILPGLILSTINCFAFLVYPLIRRLMNKDPTPYSWKMKARLDHSPELSLFHDFRRIVWVELKSDSDGIVATPISGGSSKLSVMAKANGYIVIPEQQDPPKDDRLVDVHFLPGVSEPEAFLL